MEDDLYCRSVCGFTECGTAYILFFTNAQVTKAEEISNI